uniref:F-box domain-containing protein n=1 Tax=Pristionchus pacificus TaxID=54126 RepID=A0A8R1UID2_PRIPA
MSSSPPLKRQKLSEVVASSETSQDLNDFSSIELLPRELLWAIVEYAPGSVASLRLVSSKTNRSIHSSRTLQCCVDKSAQMRTNFLLCKQLTFSRFALASLPQMDPPPPVLATQESVDFLTKLVKSLHVKLDKLFSSSATVPAVHPVSTNSTYASVVRAIADSDKIKAKSQCAVLAQLRKTRQKRRARTTRRSSGRSSKQLKTKTSRKHMQPVRLLMLASLPHNPPGRRIVKYSLPSFKLRDKLLAGIRTVGRPSSFEPSMYVTSRMLRARVEKYALQESTIQIVDELEVDERFLDVYEWHPLDAKMSDDLNMFKVLGESVGRYVPILRLLGCHRQETFVRIHKLIDGIEFDKLEIEDENNLLKIINSDSIYEVDLKDHENKLSNPARFLLDLSDHVVIVRIAPCYAQDKNGCSSPYFFGLNGSDLAPLIVFSRRLDTLYIEGSGSIGIECARILREELFHNQIFIMPRIVPEASTNRETILVRSLLMGCSMEAPAIDLDSLKLSPNVDQEMETLSPIERLPRELVWKIIDFVPEAVLNLMATSPALQWRVLEYARQPLTIPILDRVGISRSNSINTRMWVWMYVPKRLSTLFELRLIVRERPPTMTRTIKRLFHEVPFHPSNQYRYELDANMDGSPTIDYLRGIFGNHLGYFWVNGPSYNNLMSPYVIRLLDGMRIRRLEMMIDDLSEEIASQILERIKKHACEQLILTIRNVAASKNAVQFLHDLSSAVRSIRIIQSEVAGICEDANFLFGIQDGDWARVILEMFSRKVDKLLIDTHYKGYLTKGGVDFLREKLPSLGEKVWFDTDCIAYENDMNYVRDGLSVAFDGCSMEAPAIKLSPNVDQEMDTLSPIERLPRELVWKIIDFVPEAVLNLMATSPALQWRVLEYARQPLTIPILDRVGISRSNSINTRMWVWMYVPKRLSTLFELRLIVRERPPTMTRTIKRLFHEVPFHLYRYELDANMDGSPTIDYLRGIFGNHLGYFWVNGPSYNNLMSPYVIRLLDGMKIRRLEMMIDDLSEEIASQILERIKKHACEQLILTIRNVAASKNAVQFLHDLSSAVRSIRIIQSEVAGISEDANFLFGIQDGDWARVILEMFSRKVDKLLIDTHYKGYLTKGGVDFLREKLPSLGEKVWFDTDCIAYENDMNYVRDGLSVAFDDLNDFSSIEFLPRELLWAIVEYAPGSVASLRLVIISNAAMLCGQICSNAN